VYKVYIRWDSRGMFRVLEKGKFNLWGTWGELRKKGGFIGGPGGSTK